MSVDDLHELYEQAERTLGAQAAGALMSRLPIVPAADIATKTDLRAAIEASELRIRTDFSEQLADVRITIAERFASQTRWMVGSVFASVSLAVTLVRFV